MSTSSRFEAIREPMGLWCIWDIDRDVVADFADHPLVGLADDEAKSAILLLTNLPERSSAPRILGKSV
ncbi:hypothetical protein GCM10011385_03940 [Nitratireductor aestuarii]|uniref:Uncharacterized protein n=1 Tax=Nitratireductor aestuarii TaxID=1735103 RepID=A0A916RGM6_9HYPH|nr:hypothetical protein [Nitratireductor aestuarii]GGA53663.1 hypothetical protein GCM10011385_03940 [Nitratireductor aestuarii]